MRWIEVLNIGVGSIIVALAAFACIKNGLSIWKTLIVAALALSADIATSVLSPHSFYGLFAALVTVQAGTQFVRRKSVRKDNWVILGISLIMMLCLIVVPPAKDVQVPMWLLAIIPAIYGYIGVIWAWKFDFWFPSIDFKT